MAAQNIGSVDQTQFNQLVEKKQNRKGDFGLIVSRQITYKMRGYHQASNEFEVWTTTNPAAGSPSQRTLQDVVIATIFIQKEL